MFLSSLRNDIIEASGVSSTSVRVDWRLQADSPYDAKIRVPDDIDTDIFCARLETYDSVVCAQKKGRFLLVTFSDSVVSALVESFGDEDIYNLLNDNTYFNMRITVQSIDPNATKAFHLGHLYEAVLGHALASTLEALGAHVHRSCFVSDISRSVCEATVGWLNTKPVETPVSTGEKPDHMVGRLYAEQARRYYLDNPEDRQNPDPVGREVRVIDDETDAFILAFQAGDETARAAWKRVRDWVVDGQKETLVRYGIGIDTFEFGSEVEEQILVLIKKGLAERSIERENDGTILYRSGRSEYDTVIICRSDGFPTEHARQLGQIMSTQEVCTGLDFYFTYMGMEWKPAWLLYEPLLCSIGPSPYHEIVRPVCHGMIKVDGSTMKSSEGKTILADDLLQEISNSPFVKNIPVEPGSVLSYQKIAEIVIKLFLLSRRLGKNLSFEIKNIFDRSGNPAWVVVEALALALAPISGEMDYSSKNARTLLLQSFELPRVLALCVSEADNAPLVKFLARVAHISLASTNDIRAQQISRHILEHGVNALGVSLSKTNSADLTG